MKRAQPQAVHAGADAALQYRILAMGRVQSVLTAHCIKARAFVLGLSEPEQRRLAAAFAAPLGAIAHGAVRARLMVHPGQIHGDLAIRAGRALAARNRGMVAASLHSDERPRPARQTGIIKIPEYATRR